jgi:hypothetical protein
LHESSKVTRYSRRGKRLTRILVQPQADPRRSPSYNV